MNDFERAAAMLEPDDFNYDLDGGEFAIEWLKGQKEATVTLPVSSKLGRKLLRLAESHPDEVKILSTNNGKVILAHIPISFIKIMPPAKRTLTEEQRKALSDRLKAMREKRAGKTGLDNNLDADLEQELESIEEAEEE